MLSANLAAVLYLVAAVLFVLSLRGLANAARAACGQDYSSPSP